MKRIESRTDHNEICAQIVRLTPQNKSQPGDTFFTLQRVNLQYT